MAKAKKRIVSILTLVCFILTSILPSAAFAADEDEVEVTSNKSGSQLIEITAKYLNGIGGTEIINPETYSTSRSEKTPQEIEDWVYVDYEESVDYIYVPEDIPYIVGYPDDTVRPLRYLTRAEAAAIFYRLYDGNYPKEVNKYREGKTFTDVPEDHWAHDNIVQLYESGIIGGDNHKFYPDTPITRAELAALATRFNPDKFPSKDVGDSPFKDVQDGKWYDDVVALAAANEWVGGYPDGTFKPEANVTRTETMAVINRVLQRQITAERLNEVGAQNPYTDIKSSDWYYADAIEATIPHETEDWHEIDYNDGQYNVIIENFVDQEGNTLAETAVSQGKKVDAPKDIPGFKYLGYVQHTTYIYEPGVAKPSITKTSNGEGENAKLFEPGDLVTYTIKVKNAKKATRKIENAVVSDRIPEWLTFVDGSVTVNGETAKYSIKTTKDKDSEDAKDSYDTISVKLGDVKIGKTATIQFSCHVDKDAYNKKIKNVATVKGDNIDKQKAEDEGFTTLDGKAYLNVDKTVDKTEATVGEQLTYNIAVSVDRDSNTKARNVIITDVLDENLEFAKGVMIDGHGTNDYSYDKDTRTLTVELGDIDVEAVKNVSYDVKVAEDAWNKNIENIAVAKADNADPADDASDVVTVPEGSADLSIKKVPSERKVKVGDDFYYTITVENNRNAETTAHNVVVHDTIPEQIDFRGQVTLNGQSANYNWDPETRQLDVIVGGLDPGEKAEVIIYGTISNTAYGQEIHNIAQVTADNDDPEEDEAKVVDVEDGDPDGTISTKVASVSSARPGDEYYYTITAKNANSATKDWEITITDPLPEEVTYVRTEKGNSVESNVSYDPETRTVTLSPEPIAPGEKVQWKIFVKVNEGTEGKTINNVAVLTDEDGDQDIPGGPVDVPVDPAAPSVSKTHDVDEVGNLEYVTYTVTVKNGKDGDVWQNVFLEDVLPPETQLVGPPNVDGKGGDYIMSGNNVQLFLGDLKPGESVDVTYTVQVKKGTQKTIHVPEDEKDEKPTEDQIRDNTVTLVNNARAVGDNGQAGATDDKVKVPPIIVYDPVDPPETPPEEGILPNDPTIEKLTEKQIVDLSKDPYNKYTIKLSNPTDKVWQNVKVHDEIQVMRCHLVSDSVYIDGIKLPWGQYEYIYDEVSLVDEIIIPVGDIQPGETITVEFEVRFENDYADESYTNKATAASDNFRSISATAPTNTFTNAGPISGQHNKLFAGYTDGSWWPKVVNADNDNPPKSQYLSLEEAAAVVGRSITNDQWKSLLGGKTLIDAAASLPDCFKTGQWYSDPVMFMGAIKCLTQNDVDYELTDEGVDWINYNGNTPRMIATKEQLARMVKAVGLDYTYLTDTTNTDPSVRTARSSFASDMCNILGRDQSPDFNGCQVPTFTDVQSSLVSEVSIWHSYVLHGHNNDEIWIFSDPSRGVLR